VVDGKTGQQIACLKPGDEDKIVRRKNMPAQKAGIAGQCCKAKSSATQQTSSSRRTVCKRHNGKNSPWSVTAKQGCMSGKGYGHSSFLGTSYRQIAAKCHALQLDLCEASCQGTGCNYDMNGVITKKACDPSGKDPDGQLLDVGWPAGYPIMAAGLAIGTQGTALAKLAVTGGVAMAAPKSLSHNLDGDFTYDLLDEDGKLVVDGDAKEAKGQLITASSSSQPATTTDYTSFSFLSIAIGYPGMLLVGILCGVSLVWFLSLRPRTLDTIKPRAPRTSGGPRRESSRLSGVPRLKYADVEKSDEEEEEEGEPPQARADELPPQQIPGQSHPIKSSRHQVIKSSNHPVKSSTVGPTFIELGLEKKMSDAI